MNKKNFVVVGAGISAAAFIAKVKPIADKIILYEKRNYAGGICYDYPHSITGELVHRFGAHLFHTNNAEVWEFLNRYARFNDYRHQVVARGRNYEIFSMPFNMHTLNRLHGAQSTPEDMKKVIERDIKNAAENNLVNLNEDNLKTHIIKQVGYAVYSFLVEHYTKKQWGKDPEELPSSIIKRLPIRFNYNTDYFSDKYQGNPIGGYAEMIKNMIDLSDPKIEVRHQDYFYDYAANKDVYTLLRKDDWETIFTGNIDELYMVLEKNLKPPFPVTKKELEWRSCHFDIYTRSYSQGNSVINDCTKQNEFTRTIEHRFFNPENKLVDENQFAVTCEYPRKWERQTFHSEEDQMEKLYPVPWCQSAADYYKERLRCRFKNLELLGRNATYRYMDMDVAVKEAIELSERYIK